MTEPEAEAEASCRQGRGSGSGWVMGVAGSCPLGARCTRCSLPAEGAPCKLSLPVTRAWSALSADAPKT